MVSMINKAILRKDLGKLPSVKGMVRKSDVMAVVGKQKELSLESDVLLASIKELKEEYHSTGEFIMTMWRIFPLLKDATEKLFLHTIYSSIKHISILYLVPFCVK